MSFVDVYLLFALTTAVWGVVSVIPVVRKRLFEINKLDHVLYDKPYIAVFAVFIVVFIAAPVFLIAVLSTSSYFIDVFIDTLIKDA